jgi:hypothetical protein
VPDEPSVDARAAAAAASAPAVVAAEAAPWSIVTRGLPCADCGYNLRSLRVTARCPECGRAVAESIEQWRQRWRRVLSPRRRAALAAGAATFMLTALAAQGAVAYGFRPAWLAMLAVLAWVALSLVTAVRWDEAGTRWGGVALAARVVATVAVVLACLQPLRYGVLGHGARVTIVVAYTHLTVLATTLLLVHVARVANRLTWRRLSAQALCVALLTAAGVACELIDNPQYARSEIWLLGGAGEVHGLSAMSGELNLPRAARRLDPAIVVRRVPYVWLELPLAIATFWALALWVQLALAAAFAGRPPKLHDGGHADAAPPAGPAAPAAGHVPGDD